MSSLNYPTYLTRSTLNKWLSELRNPKNRQAVGVLHRKDGSRCCLGVLADVCGVPYSPDGADTTSFMYHFGEDTSTWVVSLPPEGFCGMSHARMSSLASLNDDGCGSGDRYTFPEMAEVIEHFVECGFIKVQEDEG